MFVKILMALAFLPVGLVVDTYNKVCKVLRDQQPCLFSQEEVYDLLRYFERQWLNNRSIPLAHWNLFEILRYRTNNNVEGWHHLFNMLLGVHPNIWKLIVGMQQQQAEFELKVQDVQAGKRVVAQRRAYRDIDKSISQFKLAFVEGRFAEPIKYIQRVSRLLYTPPWVTNVEADVPQGI